MKRLWLLLLFPCALFAQNEPVTGHCTLGGTHAVVSGLKSTNYLQGIIPSCTVTVYLTGTPSLSVTSYSVASNVATFNYSASFPLTAGSSVTFAGFSNVYGQSHFNGFTFTVLASGLTSSQFKVSVTAPNQVSTTDAGTASGLIFAQVYADKFNTPLSNPFTANSAQSADPGAWLFFASATQGYDVVLSGGILPNVYLAPVTQTGLYPSNGASSFCAISGCFMVGTLTAPTVSMTTGQVGGHTVIASNGTGLQIGDISNSYQSLDFYLGGNSFLTANSSGLILNQPLQVNTSLSLNGSSLLTGAQGNGAAIQTYSGLSAVQPACFDVNGSMTGNGCTTGSTITLKTTGTFGPATLAAGVLNIPQYSASGSGVGYTTPSVSFVPTVTSASGNGTMGNSTIQDNTGTGQASVGDAWTMNNSATVAAQGTANSGQNFASNTLALAFSYFNGSAIPDAYTVGTFVNTGTAPTTLMTFYGPATLTAATANSGVGFLFSQNDAIQANSTNGNINSAKAVFRGHTQNSSGANQLDDWTVQAVQGTGNQPSTTLTFSHTRGTTGAAAVSVPALMATGGTPGVQWTCAALSTYPTCSSGSAGLVECVSDSTTVTWGATVTGGGTNNVQARCNGSAWTVEGK